MTKDNGGAAFPRPYSKDDWRDEHEQAHEGATMRDYFAAKAMQGLIANPQNEGETRFFASTAYEMADAMIAERAKV